MVENSVVWAGRGRRMRRWRTRHAARKRCLVRRQGKRPSWRASHAAYRMCHVRASCRLPQTHVQGAGALRNTAATRPCMAAGHDMTRCPSRRTADELEKACGTCDGRYRKGRAVPGGRAACDRQWHHACHPRARAGGPDGFSNSPRVSWRAQNPLQKSCVGWFVPLIRLPLDRITSRWPEPVHARATAILAAAIATGICRSLHGHAR